MAAIETEPLCSKHYCTHVFRTDNPETPFEYRKYCVICDHSFSGTEEEFASCVPCQAKIHEYTERGKLWGPTDVVISDPCCNLEVLIEKLTDFDLRRGFAHIRIPTLKPCKCKTLGSSGPFQFVWPLDIGESCFPSTDNPSLVTIYLTKFYLLPFIASSTAQ